MDDYFLSGKNAKGKKCVPEVVCFKVKLLQEHKA